MNDKFTGRGLSGLENIGNTCYMNSILQCLCSLDIFRVWLLTRKFEKRLCMNLINMTKSGSVEEMSKETVTYRLAELFTEMWKESCIVVPKSFKKVIGNKCVLFKGSRQHDSQEFLNCILDQVHEETKSAVNIEFRNVPQKVITYMNVRQQCLMNVNDSNIPDETKDQYMNYLNDYMKTHATEVVVANAYHYWKNYITKSHSIITDLFTGLFYTKTTCMECKNISTSFEAFNIISLQTATRGTTTLHNSFTDFVKEEQITGDNQYDCLECKKKVDALRQIRIWEPPTILIVHLKRFKNTGMTMTKTSSMIQFPIESFDIQNYISDIFPVANTVYDLYAISEHRGSCNCGHYVAYCKNSLNNKWYEYNDDTVTYVPYENLENEVVTKNAYVLFYVRRI